MSDAPPGPLVGKGRAADVYDVGDGRVLRRYRRAFDVSREAEAMRHVRAHGYPVPEVFDASGSDLVMQRLDGPTMLDDLARRPWRLNRHARTLAELHRRLGTIPTDDLSIRSPFGPGGAILHLDLHPDNVMLTADGPVVIDWSNVAQGPGSIDGANTWVIITTSDVDESPPMARLIRLFQGRFGARFVKHLDPGWRDHLTAAVEHRLADRNLKPTEITRLKALLLQVGTRDKSKTDPS